ncbi:Cyclin-B1-2 [Platanthera zijinensis]|uniref:Cyclin-B1-2 n=1 Tax=Platanthera zijinensis TaxID=2320716 RepID=A0AAP0FU43_9ASPA
MVSSVGTCSEAGRPSSGNSEPRTAFLRRFRAPDVLPPAIPSALLHRTPKQSAAFQNCSPEIYFKTALSGQQLFNPPELSQTDPRFQRPPGMLPSSMVGYEALTGSLEDFGFEDYLNMPQDAETFIPPDMHHGMEVRLGLSRGPVCPSFI